MCVKLNSLFDSEMKVYYVTQVLKEGINIKKEITFIESLSRRVGQDRNCYRKSCLLNCWSLLLKNSSTIQVHIVLCKVDVSFVATFKILNTSPQNSNHNL